MTTFIAKRHGIVWLVSILLPVMLSCSVAEKSSSLRQQLIGGWTLVSVRSIDADKPSEPYGPAPEGYLTIGGNGRNPENRMETR